MTATIIRPARFNNRGPAIRCVNSVDEALALLRMAELRADVNAAEATADDLERLERSVSEIAEEALSGNPRSIL